MGANVDDCERKTGQHSTMSAIGTFKGHPVPPQQPWDVALR